MAFLRPPRPMVHTSRPRYTGGYEVGSGVKHHGAPYLPEQVRQTRWGAVLDPARTACDMVREHGQRIGLSACDSALRAGATPADLADAAAAMVSWRNVKLVRSTLVLADPGAETPASHWRG